MKYKKFCIKNYKAINEPIEVNLDKKLLPIIGVNECGKSTILKAIYAFDCFNDNDNESLQHLSVENLYELSHNSPAEITASISITEEEIKEILKEGAYSEKRIPPSVSKKLKNISSIEVTRFITNEEEHFYKLDTELGLKQRESKEFVDDLIRELPHILYYDDFKTPIHTKVQLPDSEKNISGILNNIKEIFKKVNKDIKITELGKLDNNKRNSIIAAAEKVLNNDLAQEWEQFNISENSNALDVRIQFEPPGSISFSIFDSGIFFDVWERSKGFYWYFNFILKLVYNNKYHDENTGAIFLLDEPGSYLHSYALEQLSSRLQKLAVNNTVIYCTHSHYLLNPKYIPVNNVSIAHRTESRAISLKTLANYSESSASPFQVLIDALQVPLSHLVLSDKIVITEGITDYYAFELFKPLDALYSFYPAQGATTVASSFPLLFAKKANFVALWDNDEEGRKAKDNAARDYNTETNRLLVLPILDNKASVVIQDLFYDNDLEKLAVHFDVSPKSPFSLIMAKTFYSSIQEKEKLKSILTTETINNFSKVYNLIEKKFQKLNQ